MPPAENAALTPPAPSPLAAARITSTPPAAGPRITIQRATMPAPADRSGERRVRRGQVAIDGKLDLHGYTQDRAFAVLTHFLFAAHVRGAPAVLVVTGKGGRFSDGEAAPGVLKRRLPDWLASPGLRPIVSGMAPAHRRHGGAGASYVFLRRVRPMDDPA
jgi:DNA-nicking Smr family endonuclease